MARLLLRLFSMKSYQVSFFDESQRLAALSRLNDPLVELAKRIDFEIFRPILTEALRKAGRKSPAGRKPLDVILMFKALIIQRLFNLSDEQLEYQITDRLSFTRFLGLHIGETIPDYTSFWGFREALAEKGLERELFEHFAAKLEAEGVFAKTGSIIDATIVEVPRQRNKREENERIKADQVPAEWDEAKRAHKDTDARWVKKNGVSFFGYKDHIKTNSGTNLITDYRVTSANVHDSVPFEELVGESDQGTSLHADSAYKSAENDERLEALGIKNQIHEKGNRAGTLSEAQRRHNRQKSKIRALVEHVFGFMENSMNRIFLRTIGMKRAKCAIWLANLVYNLCRYTQLIRLGRIQAA
jgi:IS5 family transposase